MPDVGGVAAGREHLVDLRAPQRVGHVARWPLNVPADSRAVQRAARRAVAKLELRERASTAGTT